MENDRLIKFYRRLSEANVPAKVRLELTRGCNLKCIHCKVDIGRNIEDELAANEYDDILSQLEAAGAFQLNITGGEIYSRPDIDELLNVVFRHDFLVNIQTNATLINEDQIKFLIENRKKIVRVGISVYAADADVHESITRIKGSFERTIKTLNELKAAGVSVAAFCLLMDKNVRVHEETKAFFERNGIIYQFGSLMIAREDGCTGPLENRVDETMLESLPVDWDGYLNPDPMSVPKKYSPETSISQWCVAGRFPNILPNGDLVPCSVIRIPIGNLRKSKFAELWSGSKLLDELRAIKVKDLECATCEYFPRCKPCVGIAYNESGSYFTKPSEYCRLTKKLLEKPVK